MSNFIFANDGVQLTWLRVKAEQAQLNRPICAEVVGIVPVFQSAMFRGNHEGEIDVLQLYREEEPHLRSLPVATYVNTIKGLVRCAENIDFGAVAALIGPTGNVVALRDVVLDRYGKERIVDDFNPGHEGSSGRVYTDGDTTGMYPSVFDLRIVDPGFLPNGQRRSYAKKVKHNG